MSDELMEKIIKAKKEALENPPKKKRGCSSCKKKKNEVNELPPLEVEVITHYFEDDIINAYHEITRVGGIREENKVFINGVFRQLFNQDYSFDDCVSCRNEQYHKLRNYIIYHLKKNI